MTSIEYLTKAAQPHPLLSVDDEKKLGADIRRWKDSTEPSLEMIQIGERAQEKLICSNIRLAIKIAKDVSVTCPNLFADLTSAASRGLVIASSRFDPNGGAKFSYYASFWIKQSIFTFLNNNDTIRVPNRIYKLRKQIFAFVTEFIEKSGTAPSNHEISTHTKIAEKDVNAIMEISKTVSLNATFESGEGDAEEFGNIIEDTKQQTPYTEVSMKDEFRLLSEYIAQLTSREKYILTRRFGLDGDDCETLEDIGGKFKLTRERIRQIEEGALKKLKSLVETSDSKMLAIFV